MTYFVGQFSGFDAKVNLVYKICDNSCIFFAVICSQTIQQTHPTTVPHQLSMDKLNSVSNFDLSR